MTIELQLVVPNDLAIKVKQALEDQGIDPSKYVGERLSAVVMNEFRAIAAETLHCEIKFQGVMEPFYGPINVQKCPTCGMTIAECSCLSQN